MVLNLLNQLQIFSQLCLIKLLGLLTGLGLLELCYLIYSRLLTRFGMLVFFINLSLILVRYLAATTTTLHSHNVWEQFVDDIYFILKRTHLENFSHHINNLHQNIKFTMKEESNGELAFLDTLLKQNNGEISVSVYRMPTDTDQYLHYSSHHQTSCKESFVSSLFSRAYSIITNKDDLHKENTRIKQVLKENRYQESIICKIFRRITNNHSLPQSQQLPQARYSNGRVQNEFK